MTALQILTIVEGSESVNVAVSMATDRANQFLCSNPTGSVVSVQTLQEVNEGGNYPLPWYTHIISITYFPND